MTTVSVFGGTGFRLLDEIAPARGCRVTLHRSGRPLSISHGIACEIGAGCAQAISETGTSICDAVTFGFGGRGSMPERDIARCKQLAGDLREQCLRDLGAGAGSSGPSKPAPPSPAKRDPMIDPPPQNPRQLP